MWQDGAFAHRWEYGAPTAHRWGGAVARRKLGRIFVPDVRMKKNKALSVLASVTVAVSLVVAPVVTTAAAAVAYVGQIGQLVAWTPDSNHADYWEDLYQEHGAVCYTDQSSSHGSITNNGKTVTLKPFQDSWPGDHWELLVVKGGSVWNNVVEHPQAGVAYASPANAGGNQANVSHWIVCKGTTPPSTEPTVVTPTLLFSAPTCDAAGAITERTDDSIVTWTETPNSDGSTTWTAAPATGYAFPDGAQTSWTVPDLDQLPLDSDQCRPEQPQDLVTSEETYTYDCTTYEVHVTTVTTTTTFSWNGTEWVAGTPTETESFSTRPMTAAEKQDCPVPQTTIEYREWVDGEWDCGDTEVTQTREVVETSYDRDADGELVIASSLRTEERTRQLTSEELDAECPLVPGDIQSICQGDVPYLGYAVTLPEGFVTEDPTPVTITFVNPDGEDYVVTDQALAGSLLWPGAKETEPKMWPGWQLVDGTYVQTDGNFAWTREGVTVRFDVNPTYSTVVEYPAASALCANPPKQVVSPEPPTEVPGEEPGTEEPGAEEPAAEQPAVSASAPDGLAATGGGVSPLLPIAGGAGLLLGLAALLTVAYQRRRATS
jgi:hypothetical protein